MDVPLCAEVSPLKMYLVKTAVQMVVSGPHSRELHWFTSASCMFILSFNKMRIVVSSQRVVRLQREKKKKKDAWIVLPELPYLFNFQTLSSVRQPSVLCPCRLKTNC